MIFGLLLVLLFSAVFAKDSISFDLMVSSDTHDAVGGGNIPGTAKWGDWLDFIVFWEKKHGKDNNVISIYPGDTCEGRVSNAPVNTTFGNFTVRCQGMIEAMWNTYNKHTPALETFITTGNHDMDWLPTTQLFKKYMDDKNGPFGADRWMVTNVNMTKPVLDKDGKKTKKELVTDEFYANAPWTIRVYKTKSGNNFTVAFTGSMCETWKYTRGTQVNSNSTAAYKSPEFKAFVEKHKPQMFIILGHYSGHIRNVVDNKYGKKGEFFGAIQNYNIANAIRDVAGKYIPIHFENGHVHVLEESKLCSADDKCLENAYSYTSDGYFDHVSVSHINLEIPDKGFPVYNSTRTIIKTTLDEFAKHLDVPKFENTKDGEKVNKFLDELNKNTGAFDIVAHNPGHPYYYPTPTNNLFAWNKTSLVGLFFDYIMPNVYKSIKDVHPPKDQEVLYACNSGTFKENLPSHNITKDQIIGIFPYDEDIGTISVDARALYYALHQEMPKEGSEPKDWPNNPVFKGEKRANLFNYYFISKNLTDLELDKLYFIEGSAFDLSNVWEAACKGNHCENPTTYKIKIQNKIQDYVRYELFPLKEDVKKSENPVKHHHKGPDAGKIVGGVIGVALGILVIVGGIFYYKKVQKKRASMA